MTDVERRVGAYLFYLGPFQFRSELDIPQLRGLTGSGRISVSVLLGAVAGELAGAAELDQFCKVAPQRYLLDIPGVARFLVEGGGRVRVQLAAQAPLGDVCSYLLGSVFGALCHQNGLLPLHGSAVERKGEVTVLLGDSGAGKSTTAACLQARGHRIVADDICLLEETAAGMRVVPVAGWVKLWRESMTHLGTQPEEGNRVFVAEDKYRMYLEPPTESVLTLRNVILLTRAEPEEAAMLVPMATVETLSAMMGMTYLAYVAELTGAQARLFQLCARALAGGQGYRLVAPWGWEQVDGVLDLLEQQLFS